MTPRPTPSQTAGPYLSIGLAPLARSELVAPGSPGAVVVVGRLFDGAGIGIPDGVVEIFQADARGAFASRAGDAPDGFGRCLTEADGSFSFTTTKPGPVRLDSGELQAPHLEVLVFARGMLRPVRTRCYFPDEQAANALDPVLSRIERERRTTLVARDEGDGRLAFDIFLQGARETVFFGC